MTRNPLDPSYPLDPLQAMLLFCGLPGVKLQSEWFINRIPPLPGNGSPQGQDLNRLIAPLLVLKIFGTSESLMRKHEVVNKAAVVLRELAMMDSLRDRLTPPLDDLTAYIMQIAEVSRHAENFLSTKGWTFDPVKGKVRQKGRGHRGKDFFSEVVWAFYSARYSDKRNNFTVRRKISEELSPYFDESELSADTKSPIYRAIYDREKRAK